MLRYITSYVNKYETTSYIVVNSLLLLLIAQFDLSITSEGLALFSILILIAVFLIRDYLNKSLFATIILIYISSFFQLSEVIGHSFSYIILSLYIISIFGNRRIFEKKRGDTINNLLIGTLLLFNIIGWSVKAEVETRYFIPSILTFLSFMVVFNMARSIIWNLRRVQILINIISILMIYALSTAIISNFDLIPFESPLWSSYEKSEEYADRFFYSMMERPTTAISAMYAIFLLPFLLIGKNEMPSSNRPLIFFGVSAATLLCIIGFSKSHSLILGVSLILTIVLFFRYFFLKFTFGLNLFVAIISLSIIFALVSPIFQFEFLLKRFQEQPEIWQSIQEDPITMEGTSRYDSFRLGMISLNRENWAIGYGYSNGGQNRIAWFGQQLLNYPKKDFHNTYYSLPQLFGWAGSLAYLFLFLVSLLRLRKVFISKSTPLFFRILAFSFFMMIITHLLTEYSITALSSPHYMLMIFIILGLSNSIYYNYKYRFVN